MDHVIADFKTASEQPFEKENKPITALDLWSLVAYCLNDDNKFSLGHLIWDFLLTMFTLIAVRALLLFFFFTPNLKVAHLSMWEVICWNSSD